jgi:hypothetical protein
MYEDLHAIAQLRFAKESDAISKQTQHNLREASSNFAARAGAGIRSGQHEALLGRLRIDGVEQLARSFNQIWIELIKQRNGHIGRSDIPFIANEANEFIDAQKGHIKITFTQYGSGGVSLIQEGIDRLSGVSANLRRDLEIMVREHEAFPKVPGEKTFMNRTPSRYSVGRRVLFGIANRLGIVKSVGEESVQMGEFLHEIEDQKNHELVKVLGCDIRPIPGFDEDLRMNPTINIQNSNIANLNLGSQIGTINASLQQISQGDESQKQFADALQSFTDAVVAAALGDADKKEVVGALSTIADEATKKPEERSTGTLKAVVAWIPHAIATAAHLTAMWDKFGPVIRAHFGI